MTIDTSTITIDLTDEDGMELPWIEINEDAAIEVRMEIGEDLTLKMSVQQFELLYQAMGKARESLKSHLETQNRREKPRKGKPR